MHILLIYPHFGVPRTNLYSLFYYRSLALEQVSAVTPNKHTVDIVDETFEKIPFEKQYDLVGISCLTCNALRAYQIADEFRARRIPLVLGGYHATTMPQEAIQHANAVVIGEAEGAWPRLIADLEHHKLQQFYRNDSFVDPAEIPAARRSESFKTLGPVSIQAARGCPTQCAFCAMQKVEGSVYRPRPIQHVLEEIRAIKKKYLYFTDASLTINPTYTKTLFLEMCELNKRFDCYGNINVLGRDEQFLKLASEAGCKRWLIGFESISQEAIDSVGKKTNKVQDYAASIKNIHDHGMMASGLFMFGFDSDYPEVFDSTLEALRKWDIDTSSFSIVTPYPGTQLYMKLHSEGRITSYDWSKYSEGYVNFNPLHMSQKELLDGVRRIGAEFYSTSYAFTRCLRSHGFDTRNLLKKFMLNFYVSRAFNKELYDL